MVSDEQIQACVKAWKQGEEDALALAIGSVFLGAAPAGELRGYHYGTPEMSFYIDGYMTNVEPENVTTNAQNIITAITKAEGV